MADVLGITRVAAASDGYGWFGGGALAFRLTRHEDSAHGRMRPETSAIPA